MSEITLDKRSREIVEAEIQRGNFREPSEVVREALHLLDEQRRYERETEDAIDEGLADVAAGRVHDADEVFKELLDRYGEMARQRGLT